MENSGKKVFIAEVSDEMQGYKMNLIKELEYNNCEVRQISPGPSFEENYLEMIEQCDIAIHLLSFEDKHFDSGDKGLEEQQIEYSLQHLRRAEILKDSPETPFSIYAWLPRSPGHGFWSSDTSPPHINRIRQLEGLDLLQMNFEEFKQYIIAKIHEEEKKEDDYFIKGNQEKSIYFIYDQVDGEAAGKYTSYLSRRGFRVLKPTFKGDVLEIRREHHNSLKKFDIAIIFADKASATWANMKIMDILKARGLGREKPILEKAIITTEEKRSSIPLIRQGFTYIPLAGENLKGFIEDFLKNAGI